MAGGRPPKYRKRYCKALIEYRSKGGSYSGFAGSIRVGISTLYLWEKEHPEFLQAKKIAQGAFDECMDKIGMNAMMGRVKGFNSTVWVFTRKNCSGWRDKVDVNPDDDSGESTLKGLRFLEPDEDDSE